MNRKVLKGIVRVHTTETRHHVIITDGSGFIYEGDIRKLPDNLVDMLKARKHKMPSNDIQIIKQPCAPEPVPCGKGRL